MINLSSLEEYDFFFNNDFDVDFEWLNNGDIYFFLNCFKVVNVFCYVFLVNVIILVIDYSEYDVMGFVVDGSNVVYEYFGDLYLK